MVQILTSEKPWIGSYSQVKEPILYYFLASVPLQLFPADDVTTQLYLVRSVSLVLFLVTIIAGWGVVAELTPEKHPLRFLIPLTMALLPAFVDLMTAVNNDVGAVAVFSLFLWGCVRLIKRGLSFWTLLWVLVATILCLFMKRSVFVALPLLGVALVFGIFRGKWRKVAWGLMIILGIVGIFAIFTWGDAALWYRDTLQNFPTRESRSESPEGEAVFRLSVQPEDTAVELVQIIPTKLARELSGESLTLGAWIWASQLIEINTAQMRVYHHQQNFGEKIVVDETPRFYSMTITPIGNTERLWVLLEPGRNLIVDAPVDIYYDGVVLTKGEFPNDVPPQFDEGGSSGTWDGVPFQNLVRNASAEQSWVYLRPWADTFASKIFSDYQGQESFSLTIYTIIDGSSVGWYFRTALETIFRTFWAKFAWGHVPLVGMKPYRTLLVVTLMSMVGLGIAFWQHRQRLSKLPWDVLFLFVLTLLIVGGPTILRGTTYIFRPVYYPVARYVYPAIIPFLFFFSVGWLAILTTFEYRLRLPPCFKYLLYGSFFLLLNLYSLNSILNFYG